MTGENARVEIETKFCSIHIHRILSLKLKIRPLSTDWLYYLIMSVDTRGDSRFKTLFGVFFRFGSKIRSQSQET